MLRASRSIVAVTVLSALTFTVAAAAKLSKTGGAQVSFTATGPGGLKFEGTTSELSLAESGDVVRVSVPLAGLKTGIDLRDKHMKEKYLDAAKFPDAVFEVPRASLKVPAAGATAAAETQGTLKLHGQSRPVTVRYTAKRAGDGIEVTGSTRINMKEFGIEVPSYLGVTVKPDVDVNVQFKANDG